MTKRDPSHRTFRPSRWRWLVPLALVAAMPVAAESKPAPRPPATVQTELAKHSGADLYSFYAARNFQLLWVGQDGTVHPAARSFLDLAQTGRFDDVDPAELGFAAMAAAVQRLDQDKSPTAIADAELSLSRGFAAYVRAMRQLPSGEMMYVRNALKPAVPTAAVALKEAASAVSLSDYIGEMRWMNPLYAPLRRALATTTDPAAQQTILGNLQRIRAIPASPGSRYVLVDTASARLWMFENGQVVDSMKVVVGKPDHQTPMIAGFIRHAIVNPYWNIPRDLLENKIAPNVLSMGVGYLKAKGYQVLSDWGPEPEVVDPKTVDWKAVASGVQELRIRQLPGPANAMGKVKYEFPNSLGIYLHDTPDKALMLQDARQLSSGCIRLEDAARMGRWLFRGTLPTEQTAPEQKVMLDDPVPVYVTYLSAQVKDGQLALGPDPYKRNGSKTTALALNAP